MKQIRRMTFPALAALTALALPHDADAQQRRGMGGGVRESQSPMRAYAFAGWARLDLDPLNARLASLAEPYGPVGEDMAVLGGGVHMRFSRMLVGLEGAALISTEDAEFEDQRRARFSAFHGTVMLGVSIIQTAGLDIYPLIQLGGGGASLEVQERGAPAWDDVLERPGQSTVLSTAALYGSGGIGMDYAFRSGFFMGIRGTYAYTPDADSWNAEGTDVLGGPEVSLSGPSVRLLLGFGGRGGR